MSFDDASCTVQEYEFYILLFMQFLLLCERIVKNARYCECSRHGIKIRNAPSPNSSGSPNQHRNRDV